MSKRKADESILDYFLLSILMLVSFVSGFIDSIAGGGGLLLLPGLLFAGVPPQLSLGVTKFAATLGTLAAIGNFTKSKAIVWKIVAWGCVFSVVGAVIGSKIVLYIPDELVGKIIVFILPIAMFITTMSKKKHQDDMLPLLGSYSWRIAVICFSTGLYNGFFGPGTGSFLILLLYIFIGMSLVQCSATAKVFNVVAQIGGLFIFLWEGKVDISLGCMLAASNILGNIWGSRLVLTHGDKFVRMFLMGSFGILLISLIIKYFF